MPSWAKNGRSLVDDDGRTSVCDDCPCGCPPFEGRDIIYVDKHATGTGDGSSWANAYTDIQTAIDAHPKKEIQIQGYGESDTYPAGIVLAECVYLKGIGDMWIGGSTSTSISGGSLSATKIETINALHSGVGSPSFHFCKNLLNCHVKHIGGIGGVGFQQCTLLNSCTSTGVFTAFVFCADLINCSVESGGAGFANCLNVTNCHSLNDVHGGQVSAFRSCSVLLGCTADNAGFFLGCSGTTLTNCTVTNAIGVGFHTCGSSTFIDCVSSNNQDCGYFQSGSSTFINCQDINNCLSGNPLCNPITGHCDTV